MTSLEEHVDELNDEESAVLEKMQRFRTRDDRWFADLNNQLNDPVEKITEDLGETTFGDSLEEVARRIVERLDDVSEWSVNAQEVLDEFRNAGSRVENVGSIGHLELSTVEAVRDSIATDERVAAPGTGAVTGAVGMAGALADIPPIVGISMRAIHDHALCYGFELDTPADRYHALLVFAAAASSGEARREALDKASEFAMRLHAEHVDDADVPTSASTDIVERVVLRMGRGKLVESLPIVGALVGGALDQQFLKKVAETATHCYRERWLLEKFHECEAD